MSFESRRRLESLPRHELAALQLQRLNDLLAAILPQNQFYADKLRDVSLPITSWDQFSKLPLTTKQELLSDSPEGFAANLTYPVQQYVRLHRTSGTRGRTLAVLDTAEDWKWWKYVWQFVLDAAEMSAADRVVMAFSFGPFIGFWSAYDACVERGALVAPTGGMSSLARLELIRNLQANYVFCTPSYALRLADVAAEHHIELRNLAVSYLVVAGEPGGSIPAVRQRIEDAWQAKVIDHSGASEIGPWGYADHERRGLHVNESEFIAEFFPIGDKQSAGEPCELVLTCLARYGSPVIRYRTGDLVRPVYVSDSNNHFVLLAGGVLGRTDDMLIIRGVNVYPTSIEGILRELPEVSEFRLTAFRHKEMDELKIEVEDAANDPPRIARLLEVRLGLRVDVECVPADSLPRFEGKSQRFVDLREVKDKTD